METAFQEFLDRFETVIKPLSRELNLSFWESSISGRRKDYARTAVLELKLRQIYANREEFEQLKTFKESGTIRDPLLARQLTVLYNSYLENQIDPKLMKKIVFLSTEVENTFNTFRARLDGSPITNNQILDILRHETNVSVRRKAWEAGKEIGHLVVHKLLELVKLRNEAAQHLGFNNYYEMSMILSEQEPREIGQLFQKLADLTDEPFKNLKARVDEKLSGRFGIEPFEMQIWHYEDPFFQEAPRISEIDLNRCFLNQNVVTLSQKFYNGIGLPPGSILKNSDLYEKLGKEQHAYTIDIDRMGDVRILANVKHDEYWMSTMLHELGHGLYDFCIDRSLPFLLRTHAHIFTTEAVAMFFARLSRNADWIDKMAGIPQKWKKKVAREAGQALRLQQILFSRWAQVMVNFERALYANPDQDLNGLWWQLVEKFQYIRRPEGRNAPDWATKIHVCSAPVYYHNYALGEIMASQLVHFIRTSVLGLSADQSAGFVEMPEVGAFFKEKIFLPGAKYHWNDLLKQATGEALTPDYFVRQFV